MDANLGQPRSGNRTHSPHQLDRQVVEKIQLGLGIDNHEPVRFGHLRCNFREVLGARYADRDCKAARTRRRTALAISGGEPKRWVHPATSAKASSMEIRSTSGVKSFSTLMAASPSL